MRLPATILLSLLGVLVPVSAGMDEFEQVSIDPLFLDVITQHDNLQTGAIRYVRLPGGERALVATAFAQAPRPGVGGRLEAQKVAELNARSQLVGFLTGMQVSAMETWAIGSVTEEDRTLVKEKFSSKSRSEIEGVLTGARKIGSWKAKGEDLWFVGLAMSMKSAEAADAAGMVRSQARKEPSQASGPVAAKPSAEAGGDIVVKAKGVYPWTGSEDMSKQKALADACRNAIRQGVGEVLSARQLTENEQLIEDKIYSNTNGFITRFEYVSAARAGDQYEVEILAHVTRDRIVDRCQMVGILQAQVGMPKFSIIAMEVVDGKVRRDDAGLFTNILVREFCEAGFEYRDMNQALFQMKAEDPKGYEEAERKMARAANPDEKEFVTQLFGRLGVKTDVILVGSIELGHQGRTADLQEVFNGTATLKVMYAASAKVLASVTAAECASAQDAKTAMKLICDKLVEAARQQKLVEQIMRSWKDRAANGVQLELLVDGVPDYKSGKALRDLVAALPRVKNCEKKSWEAPRLSLDVSYLGTATEFQDCLEGDGFAASVSAKTGCEIEDFKTKGDAIRMMVRKR